MYLQSHRGDYLASHRGDPGVFGFIRKLGGTVARGAGSLIPGPGGAALRYVGRQLGGSRRPSPRMVRPMGISGSVSRFQETGYRGSVDVPMGAGLECPKGYRPNKTGYYLKGGQFVAPGTKCVKYRYRNPANGRALRRAIGRTASFDKLVKRNRKALRALAKI